MRRTLLVGASSLLLAATSLALIAGPAGAATKPTLSASYAGGPLGASGGTVTITGSTTATSVSITATGATFGATATPTATHNPSISGGTFTSSFTVDTNTTTKAETAKFAVTATGPTGSAKPVIIAVTVADEVPVITGMSVIVAEAPGDTASPLDGSTVMPFGAGFTASSLSLDCADSPVTVTLDVSNLAASGWDGMTPVPTTTSLLENANGDSSSSYVTVAGYNGPLGQLPPEVCNVTADPSDGTLSFNVATAPALPTPAGYNKGKTIKGTISLVDPITGTTTKKAFKTSFGSNCGAQPLPNTPGQVGTATGTTDEGDANTIWANVSLVGTGADDGFTADGFDLGTVNQSFCSADLGQTGESPTWADNYPVELAPVTYNYVGIHSGSGAKAILGGNITGANVSFTYTDALTLTVESLTSTWTVKTTGGATFGSCVVTSAPGVSSGDLSADTSCSYNAATGVITVTDTAPTTYNEGDTVASPTIKLQNVQGKAGSTVQLYAGTTSALISLGTGINLGVNFGPAGTANAKYAAPNGNVTIRS